MGKTLFAAVALAMMAVPTIAYSQANTARLASAPVSASALRWADHPAQWLAASWAGPSARRPSLVTSANRFTEHVTGSAGGTSTASVTAVGGSGS